ncbi:MAG: SIS domain-containing protein [Mycoplasmatales bacterium]
MLSVCNTNKQLINNDLNKYQTYAIECITNLNSNNTQDKLKLLITKMDKSEQVNIYGHGKSYNNGRDLSNLLLKSNINAVCPDYETLDTVVKNTNSKSLSIIITESGNTKVMLDIVKQLYSNNNDFFIFTTNKKLSAKYKDTILLPTNETKEINLNVMQINLNIVFAYIISNLGNL